MNFQLNIIDSERHIYSGEVKKLTIPAQGGEMTVLANHMSIVSPVGLGEVRVNTPEREILLTIGKGLFSMEGNKATLLVENTSYIEEISEAAAEQAREKAFEIVQKGIAGPDMEAALAAVRRSVLDLKVARRRKSVLK